MELRLLHFIASLSVLALASHAVSGPQGYWELVLPNTPMPKSLSDLLPSEENTAVNVGKGGVSINTVKPKPGTRVGVGKGGVSVSTGYSDGGTNVGVGKGGVFVHAGHKGKPVFVGVTPGPNPFIYNYAATENQLKDNPNVALFFLEKDLVRGSNFKMQLTKSMSPSSSFLPRQEANEIPFSSKKLPDIFDYFSVRPQSTEAEIIKKTIEECEDKGIVGEEKYCATSLESMVDFTTSKLGKKVMAVSTEENRDGKLQQYTITGVKSVSGDKAVVCHKQNYAYAVFYCHKSFGTKVYAVSLSGSDGTKAEAVAICHINTANWNPYHLAFKVLKVKPGTVPVCHFLPEDHVVWVPY